ncbi:MAG: hypothetical protein KDJ36_06070 [Hyphomicrobiaceae bacterium]|nr:hypothetical protein [Hyphomicrobiaceae bacterium]
MSPALTAFLVKVLAGAGILFVIGYIGNRIAFSNRFVNALVTAIVFAVIYAGLYYMVDRTTLPENLQKISQETWLRMVGMAAVVVFVIDLIANILTFKNRFTNALMTAIVFAVVFTGLMYAAGGLPAIKPA